MVAGKPSLKSVAAAAEVSVSTVSNAYNRPGQLSADLRERIFELAAQMGYAGPDPSASSLRSQRSGSIGMLFAQQLTYAFSDPYCAELLTGVAEIATDTSTNVLLMPVGPHSGSTVLPREEEMRLVHTVRQAVVDGVIADGLDAQHPVLRVLGERGIPVIATQDWGGRCVLIDDRDAGAALGRYLRSLGHRRCAVVTERMDNEPLVGPARESELFPYARLRLQGLRDGLGAEAEVTTVSAGTNNMRSGREATDYILAGSPRPTVIAATSDVLALGALQSLQERRIAIGTTMSVTGFDDIPLAGSSGLTTVHQPIREKGRAMARMLLDPTFTQTRLTLPVELITRSSTGPAT